MSSVSNIKSYKYQMMSTYCIYWPLWVLLNILFQGLFMKLVSIFIQCLKKIYRQTSFLNSFLQIYLEQTNEAAAIQHMYKSMETYLENCLGPFEDHFRDDYFLASLELSKNKRKYWTQVKTSFQSIHSVISIVLNWSLLKLFILK